MSTFCHACALFSVRVTRFSSQKLPVRHTVIGDSEGVRDLT